jgi:hypothetical protein
MWSSAARGQHGLGQGRGATRSCAPLRRGPPRAHGRSSRFRGAARSSQGRTDGRIADLGVELREQLALHVRLLHQRKERPGEHLRARVGARVRAASARPGSVTASPACVADPGADNDWLLCHKPAARLSARMQDYCIYGKDAQHAASTAAMNAPAAERWPAHNLARRACRSPTSRLPCAAPAHAPERGGARTIPHLPSLLGQ